MNTVRFQYPQVSVDLHPLYVIHEMRYSRADAPTQSIVSLKNKFILIYG
jgi:hypothetical protein